jgi:hypothetical protein
MVGVRALFVGALLAWSTSGCGGNAALEQHRSNDAGGPAAAGATSSAGSTSVAGAAAGGSSSSGGAPSETAGAANDYVPSGEAVPPTGDGRLEWGGSFEHGVGGTREIIGAAWDNCASRLPVVHVEQGGAADGTTSLRVQSAGQERADGVDSQFAFYLREPLPANQPLYLYFEVRNFSQRAPIGAIAIARVDFYCKTVEPLATIPLERLELSNEWQTRCVELRPTGEVPQLGWSAEGTDFVIGVDDFRFGPPCQH